jgi:hypothetical protein
MPIDYEELQKYFDENHCAVNDPLNPGMTEEGAIAEGTMVDATEEGFSFVIPQTQKGPS